MCDEHSGTFCEDKSRYDKYRMPTGRLSLDCGDPVAVWLRDAATVDTAVNAIAKHLDKIKYPLPKDAVIDGWLNKGDGWKVYLNNRYSHLGNGQRRMSAGLIFRSALKWQSRKTGREITEILAEIPVN